MQTSQAQAALSTVDWAKAKARLKSAMTKANETRRKEERRKADLLRQALHNSASSQPVLNFDGSASLRTKNTGSSLQRSRRVGQDASESTSYIQSELELEEDLEESFTNQPCQARRISYSKRANSDSRPKPLAYNIVGRLHDDVDWSSAGQPPLMKMFVPEIDIQDGISTEDSDLDSMEGIEEPGVRRQEEYSNPNPRYSESGGKLAFSGAPKRVLLLRPQNFNDLNDFVRPREPISVSPMATQLAQTYQPRERGQYDDGRLHIRADTTIYT